MIKSNRFSLPFAILALILVLISTALILKTPTESPVEHKTPFKVDQLLIKVLIKSNESFVSPVNIMDISDEEITVTVEPLYLSDIASVSESQFTLKPGQTKTIYINFRSLIEEKSITHEPGAYVGALLVSAGAFTKLVPMIVEIETQEVLFDTNLEISAKRREIPLGGYSTTDVTLFNLKKIGLTNVKMHYLIKDIKGNTILTESETVVVETRATFTKTIDVPENLNLGDYVFVAESRYGSSVGTSTFLFKITEPAAKSQPLLNLGRFCKSNYCWAGLILLIISTLALITYSYFYIRLFFQRKLRQDAEEATPMVSEEEPFKKQRPVKIKRATLVKGKSQPKKAKKAKKTSKKDLEREKLKEEIKEWRAKGYDTKVLEEELKRPKKTEKITKRNILNKIKEWRAKGYDTKVLEEKLRKLGQNRKH
jgi:uncharacterized protein (UPF0335 family)